MKDKPDLKIINSPEELESSNNFWRACPRMLELLPEENCELGRPGVNSKSKRVVQEAECPWWINSESHNFCFWKYVNAKSTPEGVMPELVQSDLAKLFGWSNTKTHFALKEAIKELTEALTIHGAEDLLEEIAHQLINSPND